jgi:hypothetical protein
VQIAKSVILSDGTMTLRSVSPTTITSSVRPERLAGSMPISNIVPMWCGGSEGFLKNSPNAPRFGLLRQWLRRRVGTSRFRLVEPIINAHRGTVAGLLAFRGNWLG